MTGRPSASPLHQTLREATREAHHRLDHHPVLAPLARDDVTPARYVHALAALHGPQAGLEAVIGRFLAGHPGLFDYADRRRLPALESDLADLGARPLPCTADIPVPRNVDELVGLLYVVEGATLGGHFLAQRLRERLPPGTPMRFFEGRGARTQASWQAFWRFAEGHCGVSGFEAATGAALAAFSCLGGHLDKVAEIS